MFKILWQYSLLIQIKIKFVLFLLSLHPQIFKSRAATDCDASDTQYGIWCIQQEMC